ncbi:hypothetical protein ACM9HF_16500 [Colwellia sp. RE-S-Sl-9]
MLKKMILSVSLLLSCNAYCADFPNVALTAEQCEDWIYTEYLSLTEDNKKVVKSSCAKRYSSENGMSNCTVFEGEDFIKHLKKLAKAQCKEEE